MAKMFIQIKIRFTVNPVQGILSILHPKSRSAECLLQETPILKNSNLSKNDPEFVWLSQLKMELVAIYEDIFFCAGSPGRYTYRCIKNKMQIELGEGKKIISPESSKSVERTGALSSADGSTTVTGKI